MPLVMANILSIREEKDIEFLVSVSVLANEKRLSAEADWRPECFKNQARSATLDEVKGKVQNSITYVIESDGIRVVLCQNSAGFSYV